MSGAAARTGRYKKERIRRYYINGDRVFYTKTCKTKMCGTITDDQ